MQPPKCALIPPFWGVFGFFCLLIGSRARCARPPIEDANMTAFLFFLFLFFFSSSFVVTWSRALLDGKILDLVCSGDSAHASKVMRGGLTAKGVRVFTQQHCLPLIFPTSPRPFALLSIQVGQKWPRFVCGKSPLASAVSGLHMHVTVMTFVAELSRCRVSERLRTSPIRRWCLRTVALSSACWCVGVLGSASHPRQLAYIRACVINKQDLKAYYLCVHS